MSGYTRESQDIDPEICNWARKFAPHLPTSLAMTPTGNSLRKVTGGGGVIPERVICENCRHAAVLDQQRDECIREVRRAATLIKIILCVQVALILNLFALDCGVNVITVLGSVGANWNAIGERLSTVLSMIEGSLAGLLETNNPTIVSSIATSFSCDALATTIGGIPVDL
ncbi:hypothetical protein TWF481_009106 [Arthrobotrys musiformis]|uniref:Uncharacterized protein n=1 Tax=Arthrobotrys musiformis TaxID=47236 RepID=A0AAV9W4S6_9PEZI